MSFQSFEKTLPPKKNRPKNLPSFSLVAQLNKLCQNTDNDYDARNHILTINSFEKFVTQLQQKLKRSLQSFERQLKFSGFKKRKFIKNDYKKKVQSSAGLEQQYILEEDQIMIKYFWRGNREAYIGKELQFSEQHLVDHMIKSNKFRQQLWQRKIILDQIFDQIIFSLLTNSASNDKIKSVTKTALEKVKQIMNTTHQESKEIANETSKNWSNQLSLYRLLNFKENQPNEE